MLLTLKLPVFQHVSNALLELTVEGFDFYLFLSDLYGSIYDLMGYLNFTQSLDKVLLPVNLKVST